MSNQAPFTLHIFVADGDPDGLRVVERSNWSGKALVFPRALYPKIRSRAEFGQTGVYMLLGPRTDGDGDTGYIGEGDPVRPRFDNHYANKDFWQKAVFFVAGTGLNKAHVQYLEAKLVSRANAAKRMPLENGNNPSEPTLSEADRADMAVFLHNILGMFPVLGIDAFEQSPSIAVAVTGGPHVLNGPQVLDGPQVLNGTQALTCHGRGVTATGHDTPQGFVVQSGSFAVAEAAPSLQVHFPNVCKLRAALLKSGVLVLTDDKLKFTQDYTFISPSRAAAVVLGRSGKGRADWKNSGGRTLRDIQQDQAHN